MSRCQMSRATSPEPTQKKKKKRSLKAVFAAVAAVAVMGASSPALSSPVPPADLFERPGIKKLELEWQQSAKDICILPKQLPDNATAAQQEVDRLLDILGKVPLGAELIARSGENNVLACIGEQHGSRGYYDNEVKLLALKPDVEFWQKVIISAHELHHANQDRQGFKRTLKYSMQEAVRFTFVVESDAQAIATLIGWQLKEAGYPQAWDAVKSFTKYKEATNAFEAVMTKAAQDGRPVDDALYREATLAAFVGWQQSKWLTDSYRFQAIVMYTDELDETKLIQSYKSAPEGYYDALGRVGDFSYNPKSALPTHDQVMTKLPDPPETDGEENDVTQKAEAEKQKPENKNRLTMMQRPGRL